MAAMLATAGYVIGRPARPEIASGKTARGRPTTMPSRLTREAGFESIDFDAGGAAKVIATWLTLVVLVLLGLLALFNSYARQDRADAPPVTAQTSAKIVPPGPRLQADPPRDLAALRNHEAAILEHYAVLPGDARHVRIPIDRAMVLVVGRSLDPQPDAGSEP